jgi:WD40 repeat protein
MVERILDFPVYHFTLSVDQSLAGMETSQGIQIFDLETLQVVRRYISPLGTGALNGAGVSPDGSLFLSGNSFGLHIWDNASGQMIGVIDGLQAQGEMAFSVNQRLVSISGEYGVFSVWGVPAE